MKQLFRIIFIIGGITIFNSCKKLFDEPDINYHYTIPVALNDGLEVSDLSAEGLKKDIIVQMTNHMNVDFYKNIHSVVIVRNNKLVYENYFNGYDRNMVHNLYSASKSFTSALIGIAIDKGFIADTNVNVLPYFPEFAPIENNSQDKQNITLRHLLTMSSGLPCNDWDKNSPGRENTLYEKKDFLKYLLNLPMASPPGTNSAYCSGGVILLSNIISKSTGKTYNNFARETLLEPLGISNYKWDYRKNNPSDPDQIYLLPRDMAKFGMLYLNDGKWNNNQIISKDWVNASFRHKTKLNNVDYGFLWWIYSGTINGAKAEIYTASGNGGQFIYIIPSLNMVVTMTGGNLDSGYTSQGFNLLYKYIIPSAL